MTTSSPSSDQLALPLRRELTASAAPFVVSDSNAAAFDALSDWPNLLGGVMALAGPEGCGKSHLAQTWAERVGAIPLHGDEAAHIDPLEIEGRPVLLDDARLADEETLFHLFNLAQADGGALLLMDREAPIHWPCDLPDLRSRLNAVPVVLMQEPDDTVMAAILNARFAERSIAPGDGVIDYLVRRIDRSAAAANAIVDLLDARQKPVTRALARMALDDETSKS